MLFADASTPVLPLFLNFLVIVVVVVAAAAVVASIAVVAVVDVAALLSLLLFSFSFSFLFLFFLFLLLLLFLLLSPLLFLFLLLSLPKLLQLCAVTKRRGIADKSEGRNGRAAADAVAVAATSFASFVSAGVVAAVLSFCCCFG